MDAEQVVLNIWKQHFAYMSLGQLLLNLSPPRVSYSEHPDQHLKAWLWGANGEILLAQTHQLMDEQGIPRD
ncbi:MAG: hypothetical protein B7733_05845 [Myxococcales bacterium FL481]|nr:MAG: hypothetical protein B7733_05845 [Myxococcales bacterium FL481]